MFFRGGVLLLALLALTGAQRINLDDVDFDLDDFEEGFHASSVLEPTEFHDDDEFEGFESLPKAPIKDTSSRSKPVKAVQPRGGFELQPQEHFYFEIGAIVFLVFYLLNFFIGYRTNNRIAEAWCGAHMELLEKQFSRVCHNTGETVRKESCAEWTIYCTGRQNCLSMTITLRLVNRHDLLLYLWDISNSIVDEVVYDVRMPSSMNSFVFAIVPRKKIKSAQKDNADLDAYTVPTTVDVKKLDKDIRILSEADELVSWFVNPEVVETLNSYKDSLGLVHLTDQMPASQHAKMLRFVFKIVDTSEKGLRERLLLTRMATFLIDQVAKTTLSRSATTKALRARQAAAEKSEKSLHEQQQKDAQNRKIEKVRAEKEARAEAYSKMNPEQKRRWEEKEAKRLKKLPSQKQKTMKK